MSGIIFVMDDTKQGHFHYDECVIFARKDGENVMYSLPPKSAEEVGELLVLMANDVKRDLREEA